MFGYGRKILPFCLSVLLLTVACDEVVNHKGKTPLVSVDKEFLYREDVDLQFATNRPLMDSVAFVKEYVRHWLEDVLLYKKARMNVADSKKIDQMVESYKKSLFLNIYQERLVEQQLEREISDNEISVFYEENKEMFLLDEPMMQGLFLKLPKNASKLSSVRKWCKGETSEDLENLEKYTLTNAITYENFFDKWYPLSALAAKMPINEDNLLAKLKNDEFLELGDSTSIYMLNATYLLLKGEQLPLELAQGEIRNLLINSLKASFVNEVKRNLCDEALVAGDVEFYDKESSNGLQQMLLQPDKNKLK